jgi:hypothetical protein
VGEKQAPHGCGTVLAAPPFSRLRTRTRRARRAPAFALAVAGTLLSGRAFLFYPSTALLLRRGVGLLRLAGVWNGRPGLRKKKKKKKKKKRQGDGMLRKRWPAIALTHAHNAAGDSA